jgi:Protein of unknown function (DUF3489)
MRPQTKTRPVRKMARPQAEASDVESASAPKPEIRTTKTALVLSLLQRSEGASLAQLVAATGWLPHTARAALTGLKKKGHAVARSSADGESRYTIAPAASE